MEISDTAWFHRLAEDKIASRQDSKDNQLKVGHTFGGCLWASVISYSHENLKL